MLIHLMNWRVPKSDEFVAIRSMGAEQPIHRVTQYDMKCALRVAGEMELADEFHAIFGTPSEEVYAIFDRRAEKPFHFQAEKVS